MPSFFASLSASASQGWADTAYTVGRWLPSVLAAALVLAGAWIVARVAHAVVGRVMSRTSTTGHVDLLVARFARATVMGLGVVAALGVLGVNVGALVASLGLVGLTLGLALKDVLANYVSGVMLLIQGPFKVGDTVVIGDKEGVVQDITTRDTTLRGADGRHIHIPNSTVFGAVVVNVTTEPVRRLEITLSVPADADLASARGVVLAALSDTGGVLSDPAPDAQVSFVGPAYARLTAHAWVDTREHALGDVQGAATVVAVHRLHEAGVQGSRSR